MAAPPRGRGQRPRQQTTRSYAPMAAAVVAALGVIAALGFFVLPADADPNPERDRGTVIAAPTIGQADRMTPEPTPEPTDAVEDDDATDSSERDLAVAGVISTEPPPEPTATATVRVINRLSTSGLDDAGPRPEE